MRIVICNWKDVTHPGAGGAEVYTQECARRWAAWGHDVTLLCSSVDGQPPVEDVHGVRVVRHGSRLGVYGATARFLEAHGHEADVVVDEINTRPFFAHRHLRATPSVALMHQLAREVWFHEVPWPVAVAGRFVLEPMWLRSYAHIPTLTVSASSADSLHAYGFRRVEVVPEGVELPAGTDTAPPKRATPMAVFCGRLVSMKRPDHAIAAFERARSAVGDGFELHVIGSGPLEARIRSHRHEGVILHGRVSQQEKFRLLGQAHVLLSTSVREGWGLVVSEAAAVGTPTLAYDVAGLRDSVAAAHGRVVPPDPRAMGDALREWMPELVSSPRAAIAHGGAHSWDEVARAVLERLEAHAGDRVRTRVAA